MLATYEVRNERRIEVCQGDLANVGPGDASDLLVVSAFPDDYFPTAPSLIGQLARRGLSVKELAADKEADLRVTTSCWISKRIDGGWGRYGFDRILCYEPRWPPRAAETVGDLFRALVPYVGATAGIRTVAMPVVSSGSMGRPIEEMLPAILDAAVHWMTAGLALERLRIVIRASSMVWTAAEAFSRWRSSNRPEQTTSPVHSVSDEAADATVAGDVNPIDVFISYAREDGSATADQIVRAVTALRPATNVFLDKLSIDIGMAWQQHIANSIDASHRVVIVLTPGFLLSRACQEELNMAYLKHQESQAPVLFPMYVLSCERLPLHLRVLEYFDCREQDPTLIKAACENLVRRL